MTFKLGRFLPAILDDVIGQIKQSESVFVVGFFELVDPGSRDRLRVPLILKNPGRQRRDRNLRGIGRDNFFRKFKIVMRFLLKTKMQTDKWYLFRSVLTTLSGKTAKIFIEIFFSKFNHFSLLAIIYHLQPPSQNKEHLNILVISIMFR